MVEDILYFLMAGYLCHFTEPSSFLFATVFVINFGQLVHAPFLNCLYAPVATATAASVTNELRFAVFSRFAVSLSYSKKPMGKPSPWVVCFE